MTTCIVFESSALLPGPDKCVIRSSLSIHPLNPTSSAFSSHTLRMSYPTDRPTNNNNISTIVIYALVPATLYPLPCSVLIPHFTTFPQTNKALTSQALSFVAQYLISGCIPSLVPLPQAKKRQTDRRARPLITTIPTKLR